MFALLGLFAATAAASATATPVVAVEAGANSSLGRHLCGVAGPARVKIADGRLSVPADTEATRIALDVGDCSAPDQLSVWIVPALGRGGTVARLYVDEGRLELRGGALANAVVWWRVGSKPWGFASCTETEVTPDGTLSCDVPIASDEALSALGAESLEVWRLPPESPEPDGEAPFELWTREPGTANAGALPVESLRVPVQRFVLSPPLIRASSIDAWREQSVIPLVAPGMLASVTCRPSACWLSDDHAAVVVVPPTSGEAVNLTMRLRDRLSVRQGDAFSSTASVTLPLARCQVNPLTTVVLGGTEDHRIPLELGDRCPSDLKELTVETTPPSAAYVEHPASNGRHVEVRLGHVPRRAETLELRLLRASTRTVIGVVRLEVRSNYSPSQIDVVDDTLGELSMIPTNREVRLQWASNDTKLASSIVPVALPGYYTVRRHDGETLIRGETRSVGGIPFRFAYLAPGSGEPLVVFDSDVHYPVRPVNVPVSLAPEDERAGRLFAVFCRESALGREREIQPGELVSLPFAARNSCYLSIDRRVLTPADGTQRIRVTVSIATPTGGTRGGGFSQVLVLSTGNTTESLWLGSNELMHPFDHISVHLAHDDQQGHYAVEGEASGLPARRYQMIFGDERVRLYGSATVPTGLYRVTTGQGAGVLQFSAGVVARLALLDREGREFPFDLEFGLLGTNLSGRADLSIVAGPGITVPLLNPSEAARAAIGIHAWVEYAPTRTKADGRPIAFIFGPSISLGDFGTNL
jgi:hypothetical protein